MVFSFPDFHVYFLFLCIIEFENLFGLDFAYTYITVGALSSTLWAKDITKFNIIRWVTATMCWIVNEPASFINLAKLWIHLIIKCNSIEHVHFKCTVSYKLHAVYLYTIQSITLAKVFWNGWVLCTENSDYILKSHQTQIQLNRLNCSSVFGICSGQIAEL